MPESTIYFKPEIKLNKQNVCHTKIENNNNNNNCIPYNN